MIYSHKIIFSTKILPCFPLKILYIKVLIGIRKENWIQISFHHHHHHHIALVARISLTLSRHSSQSFIALGRSSGQHPVSSHSCWMYVRAGRPAFARPCVGVHKSTSLMCSSLLLQQKKTSHTREGFDKYIYGFLWRNKTGYKVAGIRIKT